MPLPLLPVVAPGVGAAALGGLYGLLSHLIPGMDFPRKGLWQLAGKLGGVEDMPETGAELMGRLGMDEEGIPAQLLGFGAEALTDPMTLLGGLTGRAFGKLTQAGRKLASAKVGTAASDMAAAATQAGERAAGKTTARVGKLRQVVSPESLASGAERTFARPEPGLADVLEQMGLGTWEPGGEFTMRGGLKKATRGTRDVPPAFAKAQGGGGMTLVPTDVEPAIKPFKHEMQFLTKRSQELGPDAIASIHSPADPLAELVGIAQEKARRRALRTPSAALMSATDDLATIDRRTAMLKQLAAAGLIGGGAGVGIGLGSKLGRMQGPFSPEPATDPDEDLLSRLQ